MFIVGKAEEPSLTIIAVDGQLAGDSIAVIGTCCHLALSTGKAVQLFLRDVPAVNQAGSATPAARRLSGVYSALRLTSASSMPAAGSSTDWP
jgi:hypothetical protein